MAKLITLSMFFMSFSLFASVNHLDFVSIDKDIDSKIVQNASDEYFEIKDVTVEEIEVEDKAHVMNYVEDQKDLGGIITIIDQLVAIGKRIWPIIQNNRPVVNTNFMTPINVIPQIPNSNINDVFYRMSNWSLPRTKSFLVKYTNALGMGVAEFTYTVSFQYGGKYDDHGAYLASINVTSSNITVSWGFTFNATSKLVSISNHGTMANQVAGASFQIEYSIESVLRTIRSTDSFHVTGNGLLMRQ